MRRSSQSGIALVTAILVVSLATIAATAILTSANIAIHRTQNLQDSEKAWWYAEGVESWVKSVLERDLEENQIDSLGDVWARPDNYFPVDEGFLRGSVIDLQGRFNLNNLATANAEEYQRQVEHFEHLLQLLEAGDGFQARALASAIRDWIDKDHDPTGFDGAEDSEYLGATPPRRVPNRPMQSTTELLAVKGMTKEIYLKLRDHVAALPSAGNPAVTPINVNTASEAVLRTLVRAPTSDLDRFLRERIDKPAEAVADAVPMFGAGFNPAWITVRSEFFLLRAEAVIGAGRVALYSHIHRPAQGKPAVLGHSLDVE